MNACEGQRDDDGEVTHAEACCNERAATDAGALPALNTGFARVLLACDAESPAPMWRNVMRLAELDPSEQAETIVMPMTFGNPSAGPYLSRRP